MKILAIVGGTSNPSNSETLCDAFLDGIRAVDGTTTEKCTLRDKHINAFTVECYGPDCPVEPDFAMLQQKMHECDGFVIASPIWNFGIPGNLKNFIDRCGSFGLDTETRSKGQWGGKPFYVIYTGGAPQAAWRGLFMRTTSFMPYALQYFGAIHTGTHFEPRCTKGKGVFGLVVDSRPASLAAMRRKGEAFAGLVDRKMRTGQIPFRLVLIRRLYQVGQSIQRMFT